ncbi:MAG: nicotinamidase [Acidobacteriota bacterium]
MPVELLPTDALLVIDMQQDFLPREAGYTGALGVAGGGDIVAHINALAQRFDHVILTQDWHPSGHISFASSHPGKQPFADTIQAPYGPQALWPDHCVQGTPGAELAVSISHAELILRKGFRRDIDSYSAFTENDGVTPTGLNGYLRERGFTRLFFTGLAYDFCVGFSALAAAQLGYEVIVLQDLSRAVALPGTVEATNTGFQQAGITRLDSPQLEGSRR